MATVRDPSRSGPNTRLLVGLNDQGMYRRRRATTATVFTPSWRPQGEGWLLGDQEGGAGTGVVRVAGVISSVGHRRRTPNLGRWQGGQPRCARSLRDPPCRRPRTRVRSVTARPRRSRGGVLVLLWWFVDPYGGGDHWWLWWLADEPLWVAGIRRGEGVRAGSPHLLGESVVDIMGGVPGDAGMAVLVVVPPEERLAVRPGLLDAGEPVREVRTVLQRLVLGFGERIVVGDPRPGVTTGPRPDRTAAARRYGTSSRSPGRRGWSTARR